MQQTVLGIRVSLSQVVQWRLLDHFFYFPNFLKIDAVVKQCLKCNSILVGRGFRKKGACPYQQV